MASEQYREARFEKAQRQLASCPFPYLGVDHVWAVSQLPDSIGLQRHLSLFTGVRGRIRGSDNEERD